MIRNQGTTQVLKITFISHDNYEFMTTVRPWEYNQKQKLKTVLFSGCLYDWPTFEESEALTQADCKATSLGAVKSGEVYVTFIRLCF